MGMRGVRAAGASVSGLLAVNKVIDPYGRAPPST